MRKIRLILDSYPTIQIAHVFRVHNKFAEFLDNFALDLRENREFGFCSPKQSVTFLLGDRVNSFVHWKVMI